MDEGSKDRLSALEKQLRPTDLLGQIRAIVLSGKGGRLNLDEYDEAETIEAGLKKREERVLQLGEAVASDADSFEELLPELMVGSGSYLHAFVFGLARASADPKKLWDQLRDEFAKSPQKANAQVFRGYLAGQHEKDPAFASSRLDEALHDPLLRTIFPFLQTSILIDAAGVKRLKEHVKSSDVDADSFRALMYGRAAEPIPPDDLAELLSIIAGLPKGHRVAGDILYMRLHSDREKGNVSEVLKASGRQLLTQLAFAEKNGQEDHRFGDVAKAVLDGEAGAVAATSVIRRLRAAAAALQTSAYYHNDVVKGLLHAQPLATLDAVFSGSESERKEGEKVLTNARFLDENPLDVVPVEVLLRWCEKKVSATLSTCGRGHQLRDKSRREFRTGME